MEIGEHLIHFRELFLQRVPAVQWAVDREASHGTDKKRNIWPVRALVWSAILQGMSR